jgi:beta-galactosidase/beta-glucuronidase
VGGSIDAGAAAVAAPNRLLQQLPDQWRLAYDPSDAGATRGFHLDDYDDGHWTEVATYSDTLDAQGLPDRQTVMWYRVAIDVPDTGRKPALFFAEVDGDARVWVNGREVGASEKKRAPFQVDLGSALKQGRNAIALRVDHTQITELFLGGILRPVLLIDRGS